jgi:sugar/nucleoside kinase (ribokinase family)
MVVGRHMNSEGPLSIVCVGLLTADFIQFVDHIPRSNEKIVSLGLSVTYGGPASNAAGVAAGLGVGATLVSVVGLSLFAQAVKDELSKNGVVVVDVVPEAVDALAVSTILVERRTGDRAVVSTNASLVAGVKATELDWLTSTGACLVDGHHMSLCIQVAKSARALGIPVIFDGGSWKTGTEALLPLVDLAVVSADFHPPGVGDVLPYLIGAGCKFAAQSFGGQNMWALVGGKLVEIEVPQVDVHDTLGAGDALHGAIAAAVARAGLSASTVLDALRFGVNVASASCTALGARGWLGNEVQRMSAVASLEMLPSKCVQGR